MAQRTHITNYEDSERLKSVLSPEDQQKSQAQLRDDQERDEGKTQRDITQDIGGPGGVAGQASGYDADQGAPYKAAGDLPSRGGSATSGYNRADTSSGYGGALGEGGQYGFNSAGTGAADSILGDNAAQTNRRGANFDDVDDRRM